MAGTEVPMLRRIVAFPLILLVIGFVMVAGAALLSSQLLQRVPHTRNTPFSVFMGIVVSLASVLAYKAFKRWVEHLPDTEFAIKGAGSELGLGLLTGFLLFSAITGLVWLLGGIEVMGVRGWGQIWAMLGMAVSSGVFEETLFRGLVLRQLEPLIGTWGALVATAALFGGAHLVNPDATWFAASAIALEAGLLLGAAYLLTRRLWFAIGIHAAWNFSQGWVFSVPVSGGEAPLGLLITRRLGPDWLTGGAFGLEASAVAMLVATVAGLALLVMVVRRGRMMKSGWMLLRR
jgi:membrane protease YdiL (CAAX protease family)